MGRQLVPLVFAAVMMIAAASAAAPSPGDETPAVTPAVAVQRVSLPDTGLRDEAAMVLVGTALIGLAAAVRRAA